MVKYPLRSLRSLLLLLPLLLLLRLPLLLLRLLSVKRNGLENRGHRRTARQ